MTRESLLPLAFFASGAAGLLFEVLWFRALGRVLGNTVWAAALVLTAFMIGIALGALLAARWAERIRRPARAFATAEAVVALTGCLLVWGLPATEVAAGQWLSPLQDHPGAGAAARLALALAAMLVPTTAMGTTLALGVQVLAHRETSRALGLLYAANTFGACLAPLAAEYLLIAPLGLRGTALLAAGLNLLAAALALQLPAFPAPARAAAASPRRLLAAAALAGALLLALEVVWFRLLLLYAPGTDATFAVMLALVLAGIALGGAVAPLLARVPLAWLAAASSFAAVFGYLLAAPLQGSDLPQVARYAVPLMLPAALLSGALFTLFGASLRVETGNPQAAVGRLTFVNTLGAALGAALAGFLLLPRFGIETSLFVLAAGYVLLSLLLSSPRRPWPALTAGAGLLVFPFGWIDGHLAAAAFQYRFHDGSTVAQVIQGPTTTLQLLQRRRFGEVAEWRLLTDSYSMTAITPQALRYMQQFAWLPAALHPRPRSALLISYGAGNTAQALLATPELERLTVVDVSPEIVAASRVVHGAADPLVDPRVRLVMEDGRHYLRTRGEQYDIITAEPPPPMIAGVVNLYTREYFMALAARLAPGGLATYWLPELQFPPDGARAVIAAFCDAFADCTLWAGTEDNWMLMGSRGDSAPPRAEHVARLWRGRAAAPLAAGGFEHPAQLGAAFLADAEQLRDWVGGIPAVTDDFPKRLGRPEDRGPREAYDRMMEPEGARNRFGGSRWVAQHWPSELRRESLRYFAAQPALNRPAPADPLAALPQVDALQRDTDLRTPVLWLLGSDATQQLIVTRQVAAQGRRAEHAYALGVGALAERDYRKAEKLFREAAAYAPRSAGKLAAYAACRARSGARVSCQPAL